MNIARYVAMALRDKLQDARRSFGNKMNEFRANCEYNNLFQRKHNKFHPVKERNQNPEVSAEHSIILRARI